MNIPDIWALITGIAGILSLFLVVNEKYANWKKFTIPVCTGLVGFAIGRLSIIISSVTENFTSNHLTIILIVFVLLLVALAVFYVGMKYGQPGLAYMGMIILLIIALPKVLDFYSDGKKPIQPGDYLVLAEYKETIGDYDGSIRCIEKFAEINTDKVVNEELKKKIAELRKKQISHIRPFKSETNNLSSSPKELGEKVHGQ
jgi:hypothetical protein